MWEQHLAHGDTTASAASQQAATLLLAHGTNTHHTFVASPAALIKALQLNKSVLVAVYNPLPHVTSRAVSLPVPSPHIVVSADAGGVVPADVLRANWPAIINDNIAHLFQHGAKNPE